LRVVIAGKLHSIVISDKSASREDVAMPMLGRSVVGIALSGLIGVGPDSATGQEIALFDASVREAMWSGDLQVYATLEGSLTLDHRFRLANEKNKAKARLSDAARPDVHAVAELRPGGMSTTVRNNLWIGDVVTFHIEGADPWTLTEIPVNVMAKATLSSTAHDRGVTAATWYGCLGLCPSAPVWVEERMALPAPEGVARNVFAQARSIDIGGDQFTFRSVEMLKLDRPVAVVPALFQMEVVATADEAHPLSMAKMTYDIRISLPPGVTCTTRHGTLFQKQCPVAPS
jgi:hypothetical protein